MELSGQSLIGNRRGARDGKSFQAANPQTGAALDPAFFSATRGEIEEASQLAAAAFTTYAHVSGKTRATFLRRVADGLDAHREELAARAHLETALPMSRLLGEVGRTSGQLRLFADVVEEGSWVNARIDPALPDRQPLPRPDIRSMLRPLGPTPAFDRRCRLRFRRARSPRRCRCGRETSPTGKCASRRGTAAPAQRMWRCRSRSPFDRLPSSVRP